MVKPLFSTSVKHFEKVDSTNHEAAKWITDNMPPQGSAVLADFQTTGKGLGSNTWESAKKENLLTSIILYPEFLPAGKQFMLNKIISLSVKECVRYYVGSENVKIKWPNDIYIKNRKISGILSQNSLSGNQIIYTIAGVGLNVNQTVFPDHLPNPVSLKMITGKQYRVKNVLSQLQQTLVRFYTLLANDKSTEIDNMYLQSLFNYNITAKYRSGGKEWYGKITGVSQYGHLIVERDGQTCAFDLKEIAYFIDG
jgi:BirA family transcriptional regulator, biotin operon repressor / biotin---[acetyl-CoA-carboxylase] ligase